MSLKIWLPLNGVLDNKGASDVTATGSNVSTNASGKTGSCYSFNGSSSYVKLDKSLLSNSTTEFSFACWMKVNSTSSGCLFSARTATNSTGVSIFVNNSGNILYDIGNERATKAYSFTAGTWYHVAFTYEKGSYKKIYVNGAEIFSIASTNTMTTVGSVAFIGASQNANTTVNANYLNGYLNDVRVYDHCLSPAEVKDISQALVCHAKLDEGNKNLLNSFYKAYTPTAYNAYQLSMTENMVSGETYTIQLWDVTVSHSAKADSALGVYVYWGGGNVSLCSWSGSTFVNGHADYLSKTFTISSSQASGSGATNLWLNLYNSVPSASGTMNMKISGWKLEKGSVATPYTNASDATIHDSSGYGHNGTVTGAPTYVSDTVRNNTSLRFTATSHKCVLSNLNTSAFGNSYSIAWWGRCSSFSNLMQWGFSDGIRLNGIYNGTLWNTGDGSNNPLYTPGTTIQVAAPTTGAWHHFVMTGDGTTCKVYKDGVHWATAKTYKAISGSTIYLNGWDSSTSYSNSDLYLSDFRIYATALSAADIKVLYETDVRVASKKDIQAYTFNEAGSRELLSGAKLTTAYSEKNAMYTGYTNGEIVLTGNSSIGSEYIDVFPTGKTYRWDAVITKDASNTFYLGFERYDASKTSRSNNACVYVISDSTAWTRKHVSGTVDLSTDTVNACRFIALRILNDWSSANNRKATIHSVSLREITTAQTPTIQNTGVFLLDELKEDAKAAFYKNGFVEATEFIET